MIETARETTAVASYEETSNSQIRSTVVVCSANTAGGSWDGGGELVAYDNLITELVDALHGASPAFIDVGSKLSSTS